MTVSKPQCLQYGYGRVLHLDPVILNQINPVHAPPPSHFLKNRVLYLADFLAADVNDSDLQRFLSFHVPNLTSLFHFLGLFKGSLKSKTHVSLS